MGKNKSKTKYRNLIVVLVILIILILITPNEKPSPTVTKTNSEIIEELEIPKDDFKGQIIKHTGYTLEYSETDEQPYWVAYELTNEEVFGTTKRKDSFKADPSVKTGSATLSDYKSSGYDRGHLCPAADQEWSSEAMSDSFYLSNMSPQSPDFNRRIWAYLEATVRNFARTNKEVYVVTGPILTDGPYDTIGNNKVSIPNYYYKVILDYTYPDIKAIGFILPNEGSSKDLQSFAVSIDEIEKQTNIDFFYKLPDTQEDNLEANFDVNAWDFQKFNSQTMKNTEENSTETEPEAQINDNGLQYQLNSLLYSVFGELRKTIFNEIKSNL